jgi:predicted GNAT family acetyltransferase
MNDIEIKLDPEESEYVAISKANGGEDVIGEMAFVRRADYVDVYHTGVRPEAEGQGIAKQLAVYALEDFRAKGDKVYPRCPFLAGYIAKHPEYKDLVYS